VQHRTFTVGRSKAAAQAALRARLSRRVEGEPPHTLSLRLVFSAAALKKLFFYNINLKAGYTLLLQLF
jgi:hypothetical protein